MDRRVLSKAPVHASRQVVPTAKETGPCLAQHVLGDQRPTICDVVGCQGPPVGSYLDTRAHGGLQFWVCAEHLARLQQGEQPVIVAEPDLAEMETRPALIMA